MRGGRLRRRRLIWRKGWQRSIRRRRKASLIVFKKGKEGGPGSGSGSGSGLWLRSPRMEGAPAYMRDIKHRHTSFFFQFFFLTLSLSNSTYISPYRHIFSLSIYSHHPLAPTRFQFAYIITFIFTVHTYQYHPKAFYTPIHIFVNA